MAPPFENQDRTPKFMNAAFTIDRQSRRIALTGDWTLATLAGVTDQVEALAGQVSRDFTLDVSALGRVDVAGAFVIDKAMRAGGAPLSLTGSHDSLTQLIAAVRGVQRPCPDKPAPPPSWRAVLERIGRGMNHFMHDAGQILSFLGETIVTLSRIAAQPKRLRMTSVVAVMETAGLNALPIICTLSFFIGLVVAYLGATVFAEFGVAVFTVELVGFSVLREFAVVITAVLLAGRTNSAFTAEIGAMRMRQEVDAMRVLGLDVMERLVAPRVIAMTVMTPLLTLMAMFAGLLGGLVVCWGALGVSPLLFISRIQENVGGQHFWVGLVKAPLFGFVLALISCRQGLLVESDVASLGRRTTASVVQAIFILIVLDALFALWFLEMDW
ncbi:MAG: ABC transporter permease [Caulobacterales bacterium]|jgi:phospholipid/cholesterol/gamma-HCH transport system permease protein